MFLASTNRLGSITKRTKGGFKIKEIQTWTHFADMADFFVASWADIAHEVTSSIVQLVQ